MTALDSDKICSLIVWENGNAIDYSQEVRFPPFGLPIERDMYLSNNVTVRDEVFMFGGAE